MRIVKSSPRSRIDSRADRWLWILLLVLAFGAGLLVAQSDGLHWLDLVLRNPRSAVDVWRARAAIPTLTVDIDFTSYHLVLAQRERVVRTGANVSVETDAVPATFSLNAESVDAMVRLPEMTAAELSGSRWPFEFIVDGRQTLLGLSQGMLVPVGAGAGLDNLYLSMLRSVDIPVMEHADVNLMINGASWGLYVVAELPSTERLAAVGFSPESVVVFFDPQDYLAEQPYIPVDSFAYVRIAAARAAGGSRDTWSQALAGDPILTAIYGDVVRLLRGVERGDYAPSDVFDVKALARFLAVTTFCYGSPDLDWRTLRLAYDPATQRFTPIGTVAYTTSETPLPAVFIDDPVIQRAYVLMLADFSDGYDFATLQRAWDADALRRVQALGSDASLSLPDVVTTHRMQVRALLSPFRTLFARASVVNGMLFLELDAILPFPVEVVGLDFDERGSLTLDSSWAEPQTEGALVETGAGVILAARVDNDPVTAGIRVPLSALPVALQGTPDELRVVTRIWGLADAIVVPVAWGIE